MTAFGRTGHSLKAEATHRVSFKRLHSPRSPSEFFSALQGSYDYTYLLESVVGPRKLAEYSFIGFDPKMIAKVKGGRLTLEDRESSEVTECEVSDPLEYLREVISSTVVNDGKFRLLGGAVGYISYDSVRYWEKLPDGTLDDTGTPDSEFAVCDDGIIFDHLSGEVYYHHIGEDRSHEVEDLLKKVEDPDPLTYSEPKANMSQSQFESKVSKAKEYIFEGDIFQAVLSKRFDIRYSGDLLGFYNSLRSINPSPYMYYLKMGERRIVGSSPEMLIRVDSRTAETFPIAGTRPHLRDEEENQRLTKELLADPKDRAEHVMLVDLARNDLGRVSKFGTVKTTEFMEVHQFSHVQHIVSHVKGTLRDEYDSFDALRAVFPAGTVSGAPKVRAMEIIDELEPVRRGAYAGAIGYFSYNGNSDFAITIRTLVAEKGRAYIQAGAGIVADSVPEREWFETEDKAAGLIKALRAAGGEHL